MSAYEAAGKTDEWYTPKYIFDALKVTFDLDVAAPVEGPRHVPTKAFFYKEALNHKWHGFVWMNPPFGHQKHKRMWLQKFVDHKNGIALVPDRSSAPWFQEYVPQTDIQLWVSPKIKFERPDGSVGDSPGTGTVLLGMGDIAKTALLHSKLGFCTFISEAVQ